MNYSNLLCLFGASASKRLFNLFLLSVILFSLLSYANYVRSISITGFDDAYMFVRYADNFLSGYGIAWNRDGIQTYGTTSLLYLFCIVALRWFFSEMSGAAVLILASGWFGVLAVGVNVIAVLSGVRSNILIRHKLLLAASLTCLLFSPVYRFHAVSGMDTTLSIFSNSVLALVAFQLASCKYPRLLLLAVLAGYLSYLTRPDNLVYAMGLPVCCQLLLSDKAQKKDSARYLFGFLAVLLVDSLVKWIIFADPLPLPFYAKTSGYYEGYVGAYQWNPLAYLIYFGSFVLPFLVLMLLYVQKKTVKVVGAFIIPVALTFVYFFSVVQIMGMEARYYAPALPFFIISGFLVFDRYLETRHANTNASLLTDRYIRLRLLTVFGLIILLVQPAFRVFAGEKYEKLFLSQERVISNAVGYKTISGQVPPALGWWASIQAVSDMASNLPAGTRLALSEYGYVGANAPDISIIDPLGLNDPVFAHDGFSAKEFFNRKPDLIWLPHPDYTKIAASILDSEIFLREYEFYPGAFDYGVAIRKESQHYEAIHEAFRLGWQASYPNLNMDFYIAYPDSQK